MQYLNRQDDRTRRGAKYGGRYRGWSVSDRTLRSSIPLLVLLLALGCNTSRYGMSYDERLPQIRRVAVLPAGVEVVSRHTGGMLEPRADLEPEVAETATRLVAEVVSAREVEPIPAARPELADDEESQDLSRRMALMSAINESILTHHYRVGNKVMIDYPAGDASEVLCGEEADAVLCIYLNGIVPTKGRKVLRTTAKVIGFLTGIRINVSADEAVLVLVLLDRKTGEVLWFNQSTGGKTNVQEERELKSLVKKCGRYLLKPRDKG